MSDGYFYTTCISFAVGVLIATFFIIPLHTLFIVCGGSVLFFVCVLCFAKKKMKGIACVALFCIMASLGMIRYEYSAQLPLIPEIATSLDTKIAVRAVVRTEPEETARSIRFAIVPEEIGNVAVHTKTKILVSADRYAEIAYGDTVILSGKIVLPENFTTDGGPEFDYVSYLAKDAIGYVMKNPNVQIVSRDDGSKIIEGLLFIKHAFAASINRILPSPENMFANGLLIGTRSSFPSSLTDAFVTTGTIHMVALSGYNITIVVQSIMSLLSFLPIGIATSAGVFSIILFALLVGGGSTVVRASIMAGLLVCAKYIGRTYDVIRALFLAGTIMIAINPKILAFDSSFQLSFLATLSMLYIAPKLSPLLAFLPERFTIREIAAGTLAAELAVFPLIVYKTGMVSLVSIPTNMLVLPFIPATMFVGFFAGAIGLASHVVALPLAFLSYGLLHYMLAVVQWFARLPFSALHIHHVSVLVILAWYAVLAWWVIATKSKN